MSRPPKNSFNAPSEKAVTALSTAILVDDKNAILLFVEKYGSSALDTENSYGLTALMQAVLGGDHDMAGFLLDLGADINKKNKDGQTALMQSIEAGPEMMEFILERGADIDQKDILGDTALTYAREQGSPETVAVLERWLAKKRGEDLDDEIADFSSSLKRPIPAPKKLNPHGGPQ